MIYMYDEDKSIVIVCFNYKQAGMVLAYYLDNDLKTPQSISREAYEKSTVLGLSFADWSVNND